jgi:hypothetical protein
MSPAHKGEPEDVMKWIRTWQVRAVMLLLVLWTLSAQATSIGEITRDVLGVEALVIVPSFCGAILVMSFQRWESGWRAAASLVGFTGAGIYLGPWFGPAVVVWVAKVSPIDVPAHIGPAGGSFVTAMVGQFLPDLAKSIKRKYGGRNGDSGHAG